MIDYIFGILGLLAIIIGLSSLRASGRSNDRVDSILNEYNDQLKKQKQNEKSDV